MSYGAVATLLAPFAIEASISSLSALSSVSSQEIIVKVVADKYNQATFNKFLQQWGKEGLRSILRSERKLELRLLEHYVKLGEITAAGGAASSVVKEMQTMTQQLNAIRDLIR